jgi:hypothetical protein
MTTPERPIPEMRPELVEALEKLRTLRLELDAWVEEMRRENEALALERERREKKEL